MPDLQHLHHHWLRAWNELQHTPPLDLYEQLLQAYSEPQRHYHTLQHLAECLQLQSESAHLAQQPGEVAIALWFHDAVYDVKAHGNEARSADWAVTALQTASVSVEIQTRVHALIMATEHTAAPLAGDAALLVDIDLSILGAAPARFAEYERQIRQEYAWVPEDVFVEKRKAVLQSFQDQAPIYGTALFQTRLEAQARRNLADALATLAVARMLANSAFKEEKTHRL
ncbi:N-methyl-D-aspartate receptor NMDAR2C subunit [Comamonas sp. CMM02]|uniref:HD domain-containing protein n=1 Tax=Comamonas sp. CMM02 TaxID=2769307 RepID=UPI00177A9F91|nr:N-methyl-D-aspartate receptor NMDAR2C subunit [Comamonas sp. CMM02]MBD9402589.1 N-methyl-D-aspartate receptor NMDAR2C subunit [Comamonas sp. CMM02]